MNDLLIPETAPSGPRLPLERDAIVTIRRPTVSRWPFWAALALQGLMIGGLAAPHAWTQATGTTVLLRTQMYDPYDPLTGRHVNLQFNEASASRLATLPGWKQTLDLDTSEVFVTLAPGRGRDPAWRAVAVSASYPTENLAGHKVLKGRRNGEELDFGIGNYHVPEASADALETALNSPQWVGPPTENQLARGLGQHLAEVTIDNSGNAVLNAVRAEGKSY